MAHYPKQSYILATCCRLLRRTVPALPHYRCFTDGSTNTPTSWKWEYNETTAWQLDAVLHGKNPAYSFPAGPTTSDSLPQMLIGSNTTEKYRGISQQSHYQLPVSLQTRHPVSYPSRLISRIPLQITRYHGSGSITKPQLVAGRSFLLLKTRPIPSQQGNYDIRLTATNAPLAAT